jgi:hypothetical protein
MPVKIGETVFARLRKNQLGETHEIELKVKSDKNWLLAHHPEYQMVTYYRQKTNILWWTIGFLDAACWPLLVFLVLIVLIPVSIARAVFFSVDTFFAILIEDAENFWTGLKERKMLGKSKK